MDENTTMLKFYERELIIAKANNCPRTVQMLKNEINRRSKGDEQHD